MEKGFKDFNPDKILIVRETTLEELLSSINTGKGNSGNKNTGDCNTGDWNAGNSNTGNCNTGDCNAGDYNTGNFNTGYWNTGNKNTGDCNAGDHNTGNKNTGNYNTGDCNTGNWNTGDCNTGYWNTGDFNSGDSNIGDFNKASYTLGCFNTQSQKLRFFDKETDMTFEEWRSSEAYRILRKIRFVPARWIWVDEMTDEEKAEHPEYKITGGYLKEMDTSDCFIEWWDGLTEHEKQVIKNIPNFDPQKFYLITGIKVE